MSQQKAQLVSPIETFTPPGMNVTGVVTATSFIGSGGTVTALASGTNLNVGVLTATEYYGSGSGLTGVAAAGYVGQTTAAQSGTTTIDLSAGNVVYFTQDTDTTVAFANTSSVQEVRFIRVKDDTATERTITWPNGIIWNGGSAPTLINSAQDGDAQIFNLTTRDSGVTWYGYEEFSYSPPEPLTSYELWQWGSGSRLGTNDTIQYSSPVQIPGTQWGLLAHGNNLTLSIKTDRTLWGWGYGLQGNLGLNDTVQRSSPIQIPGNQWNFAEVAYYSSFGIKIDGTLWSWGYGLQGNLGQNDTVPRSSPIQIPGTGWSSVEGYKRGTLSKKTDGTLWVWGDSGGGNLGLNDAASRSSPTQLPGTQWNIVNAGDNTFLATKTDGTLWICGNSGSGRLGLNDAVPRSSPTQVPGTQWVTISGGEYHTIATKSDGTLWTWGYNTNGELGQNDAIPRSSPIQIPGTQWSTAEGDINMAYNQSFAIKTDGSLWAWGNNTYGVLGQGSAGDYYSSPIQVPGTQWAEIDGGYRFSTSALKSL
jgi:alpha-tubulin suppressor-like RCC1 family protein